MPKLNTTRILFWKVVRVANSSVRRWRSTVSGPLLLLEKVEEL